MNEWNNFNLAQEQQFFDLIPGGTIAKVRMAIKPGGYDNIEQGWSGGYATRSNSSGSIYLSCEFVVLGGKFAKRKVWSLIGLHSSKSDQWANIGRAFIKGILNSAKGFKSSDDSKEAQNARRINSLADLDGIEFVARIDVGKDQNGSPRNEIRCAITPDHKDYLSAMKESDGDGTIAEDDDIASWAK